MEQVMSTLEELGLYALSFRSDERRSWRTLYVVSYSTGSANEGNKGEGFGEGLAIIVPERQHRYHGRRRWEWCMSPSAANLREGTSTD